MEKISKILVPTDFSACSQSAFKYGIFLGQEVNASILLVHVIELLGYPFTAPMAYYQLRSVVGQSLERVAAPWRRQGILIETHLFTGDPPTKIIKAAEDLECDLIVMGTHGRRGIAHALMGSVAERVVRLSLIPVLTVKESKEDGVEKEKVGREARGLAA